jgi:single-strand DNA-binding protein
MNNSNESAAPSNVAVIRGAVQSEPHVRDLPGGGIVVQFDVTTRVCSDGRDTSVSVPIAWNDPTSPQLGVLIPGAEVVVVGTVRRRFFRVSGATQSRTEVVADAVIPARRHQRVSAALREAADRLLDLAA